MSCLVCHRPETLCLCASMPRIAVSTRVALLADHREVRKATNTGLLAARALVGAEVHVAGMLGAPLDWERVAPAGATNLVLFPTAGARPVMSAYDLGAPVRLIVPDGDWGQTSRLVRKLVQTGKPLGFVTPPPGLPGRCDLRRPPKEVRGALSTIEAIARALAVLEGPAPAAALDALLDAFLARHKALGRISRSPVGARM